MNFLHRVFSSLSGTNLVAVPTADEDVFTADEDCDEELVTSKDLVAGMNLTEYGAS